MALALAGAAGALLVWGAAWPVAAPGRPWPIIALLTLPALLWAPGLGWAAGLDRGRGSGLSRGLDAAWIGLGFAWINVAIIRELGLRGAQAAWGQWALAALFAAAGLVWARHAPGPSRAPRRERRAALAVLFAVAGVATWRAADLARPLDGHWFLRGADEPAQEAMNIQPGEGWADQASFGWPEAGALRLVPRGTSATLVAPEGARGRLILAVRGPLGSHIEAGGQSNTVAAAMTEEPEEGPVPRYLERGVAGVAVPVDLAPGEALHVSVAGDAVYVMPGTDAIWALHGTGALRYVHYYQLLNQVENQVWAEELLTDRWLTLNQPPGWSPILAVASLWVSPDLMGAGALLLGVLLLVGLSAVRLLGAVAPGAPSLAWLLPAGLTAAHGLLMIEPGSTNFPDSLYAAATVGALAALASDRPRAFAATGLAASILRYPGAPLIFLLAGAWALSHGRLPRAALRAFTLALLGLGAVALIFLLAGTMEDVGFIVYFEVFPEHWHGDYAPTSLLPRIPEFYALWWTYTGGAIGLALLGLPGAPSPARRACRAILLGAFAYSGILATVDHHPSHYFLPLVALSGPALGAASAAISARAPRLGAALPALALLGLGHLLWVGAV